MSNMPDVNNIQRAIRVNREIDAKVLRKFRLDDKMTVKDAYILALQYATRDVELTAEDYEQIAEAKRRARNIIVKGV